MDKITQQNAALVEEAAAAAKSMEEQTETLAQMVSSFILEGEPRPAYAKPAPARKPLPAAVTRAAAGRPLRRATVSAATSDDDWKEF